MLQVLEEAEDTIFKIVAKAIRDAEDNPVLAAVAGGKAIGTAVAKAYAQTVAVVSNAESPRGKLYLIVFGAIRISCFY